MSTEGEIFCVSCKRSISISVKSCVIRGSTLHPGCVPYYLKKKGCPLCCVENLQTVKKRRVSTSLDSMEGESQDVRLAMSSTGGQLISGVAAGSSHNSLEMELGDNASEDLASGFVSAGNTSSMSDDEFKKRLLSFVDTSSGSTKLIHKKLDSLCTGHSGIVQQLGDVQSEVSVKEASLLRISGIPREVRESPSEIVRKVLFLFGMVFEQNPVQLIEEITNVGSVSVVDNAGISGQGTGHAMPNRGRSFRVCLSNEWIKHKFMVNKRRVADKLRSRIIYPNLPDRPIFINEEYPIRVYKLLLKTRKVARENGYLNPYVRGLTIFVKRRRDDIPININVESDLSKLIKIDD